MLPRTRNQRLWLLVGMLQLYLVAFLISELPVLEATPRMDIVQPAFPRQLPAKVAALKNADKNSSGTNGGGGGGGHGGMLRKRVHDGGSGAREGVAFKAAASTKDTSQQQQQQQQKQPKQAPFLLNGEALLTTLDGALHYINTKTGDVLWSRPSVRGAVVSTNATLFKWTDNQNQSAEEGAAASEMEEDDGNTPKDWTFIVEPAAEPWLYVFSMTHGLQPIGSLVQLVNSSPQVHPDGKTIRGSKTTSLLELDITDGRVVADIFSTDSECLSTDGSTRPARTRSTIMLGHAEYKLTITDPESAMRWDISYSEYIPPDQRTEVVRLGPETYIGSNQDGLLANFNLQLREPMWAHAGLGAPTTAVFEAFQSATSPGVVLLSRQPRPMLIQSEDLSTAFIGQLDGSLYVLSKENFPSIHLQYSEIYRVGTDQLPSIDGKVWNPDNANTDVDQHNGQNQDQEDPKMTERERLKIWKDFCKPGAPAFPRCLLGTHHIGDQFSVNGFLTIDAPSEGDRDRYSPSQTHSTPSPTLRPGVGGKKGHNKTRGPLLGGPKSNPPPKLTEDGRELPSIQTTIIGWLVIIGGAFMCVVYSKGSDFLIKPVDEFLENRQVGISVANIIERTSAAAASVTSFAAAKHKERQARVTEMSEMDELLEGLSNTGGGGEGSTKRHTRNNSSGAGVGKNKGSGDQDNVLPGPGGAPNNSKRKRRGRGGGQKAAAAAAALAAANAAATGGAESGGEGISEKSEHLSKQVAFDMPSTSPTPIDEKTQEQAMSGGGGSEVISIPHHDGSDLEKGNSLSDGTTKDGNNSSSTTSTLGNSVPAVYQPTLKSISVGDSILGYGSHGTVVYKGKYDGRQVAVKRLLIDFYDVAFHEVRLLQESDDHPNVVRYYRSEQCDRFLYIALELCSASLDDIIERGHIQPFRDLSATLQPQKILSQIIAGIHHLHSLKIVHRDIKPQNILIGEPKKRPKPSSTSSKNNPFLETPLPPVLGTGGMITGVVRANSPINEMMYPGRVLISDFGLCKKLENDQSSFHNTTAHGGGGTVGWRAPECFASTTVLSEGDDSTTGGSGSQLEDWTRISGNGSSAFEEPESSRSVPANRMTRAIDIFSAGCVFYYVLSNGEHPFGDRYSRERNILLGQPNLQALDHLGQEGIEAKDLISRMIAHRPQDRPDAEMVMHHPYFWSASKRLLFMQDCSDRFEVEDRGAEDGKPPSELLMRLEHNAKDILGKDWYKVIDRVLVENLGKYRKYDGHSVRDLLRALRNKKHHYQDLPPHVKRALGDLPQGFLNYFTNRFPKLMLHLYYIVADDAGLRNESMFRHYFVD